LNVEARKRIAEQVATVVAENARLREATIEECAEAAESYDWVDNDAIQGPVEHQAALAAAIRALKGKASTGSA
jgi:hypothetical protein